jgi:hypothetical protein
MSIQDFYNSAEKLRVKVGGTEEEMYETYIPAVLEDRMKKLATKLETRYPGMAEEIQAVVETFSSLEKRDILEHPDEFVAGIIAGDTERKFSSQQIRMSLFRQDGTQKAPLPSIYDEALRDYDRARLAVEGILVEEPKEAPPERIEAKLPSDQELQRMSAKELGELLPKVEAIGDDE